jgi:para-aminobenzoate synthetase/4-amino-4-deoxychorismate lyase
MPSSHRPDPSQGVFETLLVLDGEPVELDDHLARLEASVLALYGVTMPIETEELARESAVGLDLGRLRVAVAPESAGLRCEAAAEALDPTDRSEGSDGGVALTSFPLPGGLGAHKWRDRSVLPASAPDTAPLLLDRGDEVLEAGWANLFAVHRGVLSTPPLDGRILPGVTRAAAIEAARAAGVAVAERRLTRADLLSAEEVFLTSSVRRVVAARELDGVRLSGLGEVGRTLGAELRPHPSHAGARLS